MRVVNSDDVFEKLVKTAGMSMDMRNYTKAQEKRRDELRDVAKRITKTREKNYVDGRLGLIIDGTGKDYDKIEKQMRELQQLGYDSHMIFVNTSLDVALERNAKRPRKLPEPIVVSSWNNVQKNIGKFQNLFRHIEVFKRVRQLANKKVQNGIAKRWIANELEMKKRT